SLLRTHLHYRMDCQHRPIERSLPIIHWDELEVGPVLGQGASGVIYKGFWKANSGELPQEVAIKLFKGDITSDGSPLDEIQACIAAGDRPNLVTVLGETTGNPEGKSGLVFEFLPADYTILGNPPSLDSCTRDTYPEDKAFALSEILAIARGIASVVAHLHAQGIMHGDLYAHNILVNATGEAILSDFGAASFYNPMGSTIEKNVELMEVRAFGYLLEDLLDRHSPTQQGDPIVLNHLYQLKQDCLRSDRERRPRFEAICRGLKTL
ncbi:MAG: protein kinase, partial [Cyanobacteria bacterium J06641_5]